MGVHGLAALMPLSGSINTDSSIAVDGLCLMIADMDANVRGFVNIWGLQNFGVPDVEPL